MTLNYWKLNVTFKAKFVQASLVVLKMELTNYSKQRIAQPPSVCQQPCNIASACITGPAARQCSCRQPCRRTISKRSSTALLPQKLPLPLPLLFSLGSGLKYSSFTAQNWTNRQRSNDDISENHNCVQGNQCFLFWNDGASTVSRPLNA